MIISTARSAGLDGERGGRGERGDLHPPHRLHSSRPPPPHLRLTCEQKKMATLEWRPKTTYHNTPRADAAKENTPLRWRKLLFVRSGPLPAAVRGTLRALRAIPRRPDSHRNASATCQSRPAGRAPGCLPSTWRAHTGRTAAFQARPSVNWPAGTLGPP